MKKTLIGFLTVIALVLITVGTMSAQTGTPTLAGMYSQIAFDYTKMELATSSGFKTHGALKAGFSYGIAKVKGDWLYRGNTATAQRTSRPMFILVSQIDVSTQSIALIRFDAKKDHREAQYIEVGIWSGATEENKNTIPLTVTRIPNTNTLTITPVADLPAGEYLLIADQAKGYDGYDFSVKEKP
ncbi:MAG: hypothetical protein WBD39_00110 [Candidatus Acidiferrales bacterium]|jgi:hypothetical protein